MTRRLTFTLAAVAASALAAIAASQLPAAAQQPVPQVPTTVQLPTFSFFTVQTTVSVPDRGAMSLGGISRGRDGRIVTGFGPLQNRSSGSERGIGGATVNATIIDFEEIDRMLLAAAARRAGTSVDPDVGKAAALTRGIDRPAVAAGVVARSESAGPAPLPGSVAAIRTQQAAAAEQKGEEVVALLAKAQQAEADGKPAVAKIFYQMVIRRDSGPLKQLAQTRLAALAKPAAVAQSQ